MLAKIDDWEWLKCDTTVACFEIPDRKFKFNGIFLGIGICEYSYFTENNAI